MRRSLSGLIPACLSQLAVHALYLQAESGNALVAVSADDFTGASQAVFDVENGDHISLLPRISRPVDNPSKSFWLDTPGANPLAEEGSSGPLTREADVCIIGSGITGISAAWHLANELKEDNGDGKRSVVVLEARNFCSGATGRNGGHLTANPFGSFISRAGKYNISEALKSYNLEAYSVHSLVGFLKDHKLEDEVDLFEGGHVTIFQQKDEEETMRKDFEAAEAAGLDLSAVQWIANDQMHEKYGLNSSLNYTGVQFGGFNLWPCKLVTKLYEDAKVLSNSVDLTLHTNTPVLSVNRRHFSHRKWAAHTPRGRVDCSYVLHATNAYAGNLLPWFSGDALADEAGMEDSELGGGHPLSPSPPHEHEPPHSHPHPRPHPPRHHSPFGITPTRGQVGVLQASVNSGNLKWQNSWDGGGGWEYFFPRQSRHPQPGGQPEDKKATDDKAIIILGGGREYSGDKRESGVTDDSEVNPTVSDNLRKVLPRLFPGEFGQGGWDMEWTGIMGYTKTGNPFVGPVPSLTHPWRDDETIDMHRYAGQYIAAGYTGHGMPRAFACAQAVAGMITAEILRKNWDIPDWLPENYLTTAVRK